LNSQAIRITAAGLAAIILSYFLLDRPIANFAHTLHKPAWCLWLTWIADVPVPAAIAGLTGAGIAWLTGWRPGTLGRILLAAGYATLAATILKDVLKFAAGRPWPETWINHNPSWIGTHTYGFFPFHGGAGWGSFPSGHTAVVSAPCAALWRHTRTWRPLLAALPALVMLGLLGCNFHFLSDALAGALLGLAVGTTLSSQQSFFGKRTRTPGSVTR
jgi:membrane-associated phospholipid phosphatase